MNILKDWKEIIKKWKDKLNPKIKENGK